jgi:hypothetical protein
MKHRKEDQGEADLGMKQDPNSKTPKGLAVRVVQWLPTKCKTLSSTPNTTKNKQKNWPPDISGGFYPQPRPCRIYTRHILISMGMGG